MGLFGAATDTTTEEVEIATDENHTEENWHQIITICDKAGKSSDAAKGYLRAIVKRLYNQDPHIAVQAVTLLDACVKNSGKLFHIEVASREFETDFCKLMNKAHPTVAKKLRESLKKWSDNEFKTDPQLNLIPSLYVKLKHSGYDFSSSEMPVKKSPAPVNKDPNVVETQEEEEQIMKAIELSLKETTLGGSPRSAATSGVATSSSNSAGALNNSSSSAQSSSLYPSANLANVTASGVISSNTAMLSSNAGSGVSDGNAVLKEPRKVRALYDFEAAEDNELTFSSGEIIFLLDDSDPNWWKGSNQRGEGLFPSNFVTKDLSVEPEKFLYEKAKKMVQFKESVETKTLDDGGSSSTAAAQGGEDLTSQQTVEINEEKIDRLLHLLHEADPTNPETDTQEMLKLEKEVNGMGPLIDSELECVDRKHAQLTQLSADLVEALGLYHTLMREPQFSPPPPPPGQQMAPPVIQQTMSPGGVSISKMGMQPQPQGIYGGYGHQQQQPPQQQMQPPGSMGFNGSTLPHGLQQQHQHLHHHPPHHPGQMMAQPPLHQQPQQPATHYNMGGGVSGVGPQIQHQFSPPPPQQHGMMPQQQQHQPGPQVQGMMIPGSMSTGSLPQGTAAGAGGGYHPNMMHHQPQQQGQGMPAATSLADDSNRRMPPYGPPPGSLPPINYLPTGGPHISQQQHHPQPTLIHNGPQQPLQQQHQQQQMYGIPSTNQK